MSKGTELCHQEAQSIRGLGPSHLHVFLVNNGASPDKAARFCACSCVAAVVTCGGASDVTGLINAGFPAGVFRQPWQEQRRGNSSSGMVTGGENRSCLSLWQLAASFPVLGRNPLLFGRGAGGAVHSEAAAGHRGGCAGIPWSVCHYSAPEAAFLVMMCTDRFDKYL